MCVLCGGYSKRAINFDHSYHGMCERISTLAALKHYRKHKSSSCIGFVPTMGNLHLGHLALVNEVAKYCDEVIVSIFVNPTQFSPNEDYETYPRTLTKDIALLSHSDCTAIFTPTVETVYAHAMPESYRLESHPEIEKLASVLCGVSRPHFFHGVVNVVGRLLTMLKPDYVCFGKKDYQQLCIISAIGKKLFPSVTILAVETQRNASLLALSSRNNYLSATQLNTASLLAKTMQETVAELKKYPFSASNTLQWKNILIQATKRLKAHFNIDYFEVRRSDNLQLIAKVDQVLSANMSEHGKQITPVRHARLFAAVYYNGVRLIDNWALDGEKV